MYETLEGSYDILTHNSPMFHKQILSIQMKEQEKSFQKKKFFLHLGQCGVE